MPPSHHPNQQGFPLVVIKRESDQGSSDYGGIFGGSGGGNTRGWLNTTPQWQWERWGLPGRSGPGISVGTGSLPVQPTGVFIPQIPAVVPGPPQNPFPEQVVGIDPSSPSLVISERPEVSVTEINNELVPFYSNRVPTNEERLRMRAAGREWITVVPEGQALPSNNPGPISTTVTPRYQTPTAQTGTSGGNMPLDLGGLIGDLGRAYIETRYAPEPVIQTIPADYQMGPFNLDPFDLVTDPATGQQIPVPRRKKKCRRRRQRLATKSDLADLAALRQILGNGENFKAWIATHS